MEREPDEPRRHLSRAARWLLGIALFFVVLVAVALLAGPSIVHRVIGASLEDMAEGYRGTIDDVAFRVGSAEIVLSGLNIAQKSGAIPVPYIQMEELVIGTELDGWKPRTVLRINKPIVNLVDGPSKAQQQWGPPFDLAKLRKQLPFELERVDIEDAQVRFRNFHAKPEVDVYLHEADVTWSSLVGCLPPGSQSCRSKFRAESRFMESGLAQLTGRFDRKSEPDTDVLLEIDRVNARELNPLLSHYTKLDLESGRVAADVRARLRGDHRLIRIVPRVSDVSAVGGNDKGSSFVRELGVAAMAGWFERKQGKKAIELEGRSGGKLDFRLVDLDRSADSKRD